MSWLTDLTADWRQVLAFLVDCALKGSVVIATLPPSSGWCAGRPPEHVAASYLQ